MLHYAPKITITTTNMSPPKITFIYLILIIDLFKINTNYALFREIHVLKPSS